MATALLLIDVQRNMLEGEPPVPAAHEVRPALQALLEAARTAGAVVVHVQNDGGAGEPDEPHTAGWELVFPVAPGEPVVRKAVTDAFAAHPDLARTLRDRGVDRVVLAGMQSEHCIQATGRGALRQGFEVLLASGAHATYDDGRSSAAQIAETVEGELAAEGVKVVDSAEVRL